jgi:O-succinylbenzoic acid--CoA ligase
VRSLASRRLALVETDRIPDDPAGADRAVERLLASLGAALDGSGPALALLDASPERERLVSTLRVDLPLERDDVAAVVATSGSTGEPKAALLPATALLHSARATLDRLGGPGHWTLALPPTRVAGLQIVVRSLVAGTTPVPVVGRFDAEAFRVATERLVATPGVRRRYTALVPTQLVRLLDAGPAVVAALAAYDAVLVGGAGCPPALVTRARQAGVRVVTTYGMTETCGGCVYDGWPLGGVTVHVDSADEQGVGRVRIGGPVVFAGYRLRPDLTAAALVDGHHLTNDLGRLRPDGGLEILGRLDDVVISGGVNVPLQAVERAVASYPGVAEAGAVGVEDPEWGSKVVAYVVLRPGARPPALADLRDHVAATHPRAWAPREVVVVDSLPMLPSGKLDRSALARAAGSAGRTSRHAVSP